MTRKKPPEPDEAPVPKDPVISDIAARIRAAREKAEKEAPKPKLRERCRLGTCSHREHRRSETLRDCRRRPDAFDPSPGDENTTRRHEGD
jgi:hypothetical protein